MSREIYSLLPEYLSQNENVVFAMEANGFSFEDGSWSFDPHHLEAIASNFKPQVVSFFGPSIYNPTFFYRLPYPNPDTQIETREDTREELFFNSVNQESVIEMIDKYRSIDLAQAERIAYMFGGLIRHLMSTGMKQEKISKRVDFAAKMTKMGEGKSGEAIAGSMAMYILSNGTREEDRAFSGWIYHMSDAIKDDPIDPRQTEELGLSQIARLRGFIDRINGQQPRELSISSDSLEIFNGFPTVGAEFHLPLERATSGGTLWKRLALLNMSQYQEGSYIQLSRNDRGVLEIRMNPSVYPVTIANWEHIKLLIPELQSAFFTVTFNRAGEQDENFDWAKQTDPALIKRLKALGMLSYAAIYENIPPQNRGEEVNFGSSYLGQTIRVNDGEYDFSGVWGGKEGGHGQLGMYIGFGGNFPHVAYYPSMALANEDMLDQINDDRILTRTTRLSHALAVPPNKRIKLFNDADEFIQNDDRLRIASATGRKILAALSV